MQTRCDTNPEALLDAVGACILPALALPREDHPTHDLTRYRSSRRSYVPESSATIGAITADSAWLTTKYERSYESRR